MSIRSRLKIVDLHGEEGEDARKRHFCFNLLFAFAASLLSMKLFTSYANSCFELVASLKNRALKLVCAPALLGILDETLLCKILQHGGQFFLEGKIFL